MEENFYTYPSNNLACSYRFTCGAAKCPEVISHTEMPACHVDRFDRYQPVWHERNWEEVNRITWVEVLSLKEAWVYALYVIIIGIFIFFVIVLIKLFLFPK